MVGYDIAAVCGVMLHLLSARLATFCDVNGRLKFAAPVPVAAVHTTVPVATTSAPIRTYAPCCKL